MARLHGVHLFKVTLAALGSQTIDASDGTLSRSGTTTVNAAPVASSFKVIAPQQAAVGVATRVTVEVLDQSGNLFRNYTGTVTLSSSDTTATGATSPLKPAVALPLTYTFTPRDRGVHTFLLKFNEAAAATGTLTTVRVSGTTSDPNTTINGQTSLTVYPAATVIHFGVVALPVAVSGKAAPSPSWR